MNGKTTCRAAQAEHPLRYRKWLVGIVIAAAVLTALIYLQEQLAIDGCLDLGGRWDYEASACDSI